MEGDKVAFVRVNRVRRAIFAFPKGQSHERHRFHR